MRSDRGPGPQPPGTRAAGARDAGVLARLPWAGLVLALAGACASKAPAPLAAPGVFAWQREGIPTWWRYVPLDPEASDALPSALDFAHVRAACLARSQAAAEPEAALRRCLAARGFYEAACSDGRDNDGDGRIDHPDDPGCAAPHALREDPECSNGRDDDGDGLADWDGAGFTHADPECGGDPTGASEARAPKRRRLPF